MFEKLGDAFSKAAKGFSEKDLNEKDIEEVLSQLEISLLESDVATEVIDDIKYDLGTKLVGSRVNKKEVEGFIQKSLIENISSMFDEAGSVDILEGIKSKTDPQDPYLILFVGINGTGKTTTIAKMANLLQKNKNPSEQEIRDWLEGNICRCTGYQGIVAAVKDAASKM